MNMIDKIKDLVITLTTPIIAIISIKYVFQLLIYILGGNAKTDKDIIIYILGFLLGTVAASIFLFYFGSSHSANNRVRKTDIDNNKE